MTRVAVIGAGQAGAQLVIALLRRGINAVLFSNRTAEQIRTGSIMSTQGMFDTALQHERNLGLNFFEDQCPKNTHVTFCIADSERAKKAIFWRGRTNAPFQAVDQRLKFSKWMDEFQRLGGSLHIRDVKFEDLQDIAQDSDLVVVAGGKGDISSKFQRDDQKSKYDKPQRVLSAMYVHGMEAATLPGVRANLIPGVGEYFCMPGLTLNGPCEMMLFEGVPGGAFDCWKQAESPEAQVVLAKQLLQRYVPWEAERCNRITLTDQNAVLRGQYTPVVRRPFLRLSQNRLALGLGDIVVLNDPIGGQGANNASRAAAFFAEEIVNRGNKPFNEEWMTETSERFWQQEARWSTMWTNLLLEPPPKHVIDLLSAAQELPNIADRLANAFAQPASMFPWVLSPRMTHDFIEEMRAEYEQTIRATHATANDLLFRATIS